MLLMQDFMLLKILELHGVTVPLEYFTDCSIRVSRDCMTYIGWPNMGVISKRCCTLIANVIHAGFVFANQLAGLATYTG